MVFWRNETPPGGTGLYLRAALDEMEFPKGEVDDVRRSAYHELHARLGDEGLHGILAQRDPASAAIVHPHNVKRVIRALEMHDQGVSYAEHAAGFSSPKMAYDHVTFALTMDRERLYERIDARVDIMMEQGLLEEVECLVHHGAADALTLVHHGAADALTSRQAIGYKEIIDHLQGRCTLDESVARIKQRSRRYAKRQRSGGRRVSRAFCFDLARFGIAGAVSHILARVGVS